MTKKRTKIEITDAEKLAAAFPEAVEQRTVVSYELRDPKAFHQLAKAYAALGRSTPGVRITKPDGTVIGEDTPLALPVEPDEEKDIPAHLKAKHAAN